MAQTTQPVDPVFVQTLRSDITGKFYSHVEHYTPDQIEREFRSAVADGTLRRDEEFMHNLMFLVRKREIEALKDDVREVLQTGGLPGRADVSAMKTLVALGTDADRQLVDERLFMHLKRRLLRADALDPSPYLESADRVGGPRTLGVLRELLDRAKTEQKQAEKNTPDDHARIARLDGVRSSLQGQVDRLQRRLAIEGLGESERATAMAENFLARTGQLGFWGYKHLVSDPTPAAVDAVRTFVDRRLETLAPVGGITAAQRAELLRDYRLRGVCLLQAMNANLTPQEQKLLADNATLLAERKEFFRPEHDWEDVMDRQ